MNIELGRKLRVSERHRYSVTENRINNSRNNNLEALNKLSTQKKINKLSDDPISLVRSLKLKDKVHEIADFKQNAYFSKGFLDVTESAIGSIHERLSRARELAITMANDTYDGENRNITSKEVKQIINQVIQSANSKYAAKYVFSGFRSTAPAIDLDRNFLGDDGEIFLQIGPQHFKKINIPGRALFETDASEREGGHFNMINALKLLHSALQSDDKDAIYKSVDELEYQMDKLSSFQSSVGAIWSAITEAEKKLEYNELQKVGFISKLEDADIYKATSDLKRTETVLQSTLLASNKLLQPSLLNFLQ